MPPNADEPDGTKIIWISICIVIAVAALCVLLYGSYKKLRAHQQAAQEDAIARQGPERLRNYVKADGTLNDAAFAVDWDAVRSNAGADANAKPPQTLARKVTKVLKSGQLLHSMNRMASSMTGMSDKITKKIEERNRGAETEEERAERQKYEKLADDAVNPLFPLRMRQMREQKAREREEQQRAYDRAQATEMIDGEKKTFAYSDEQAQALRGALASAATVAAT